MIKKGKRFYIKNSIIIVILLLIVGINNTVSGEASIQTRVTTTVQKVLYVASYNIKDAWTSNIKSGIESVLEPRKNIELRVVNMDTMGEISEDKKVETALMVKNIIDSWKPDVVIASDDNASKYLIVPYFKDADLPFVFCGVNWDASKYGFPLKNVTGMVEVQLLDQLVKYLSPYVKGDKIGSIRGNTMTNRIEAKHFEEQLGVEIKTYFVNGITEWKKLFIQLQDEVNMILIGDMTPLKLTKVAEIDVEKFVFENTKIPTGHWDAWYQENALITVATNPKEQGEYAAKIALEILDGSSPLDIPIVQNKRSTIYLNMKLAKKLGIIFPMALIEDAIFVEETYARE